MLVGVLLFGRLCLFKIDTKDIKLPFQALPVTPARDKYDPCFLLWSKKI